MATIAEISVNLRAEVAQFKREMAGVRKDTADVKSSLTSMGQTVAATVASYLTFRAAAQAVGALATATMEAEQSQARLASILKATGHAAGLTAQQITDMAEGMEGSTLFDDAEIANASAVLLTFKSIAGDTFRDTMRLAADLSSVFGGSLQSSVTMLGKALEDPIRGLTALRRVGVSFSEAQQDAIKVMVEHGQVLQAQEAILKGVAGQVGGAAAGQQSGLTGAINQAKDAWGDMLKAWGRSGTEGGVAVEAINRIKEALEFWTPASGKAAAEADLAALTAKTPAWSTAAATAWRRSGDKKPAAEGLDAERKAARDLIGYYDALDIIAQRRATTGAEASAVMIAAERAEVAALVRRASMEKDAIASIKVWKAHVADEAEAAIEWTQLKMDIQQRADAALADGVAKQVRALADEAAAQRAMIDDVTASAVESAEAFGKVQADAAKDAEGAWGEMAFRMQFLLEDSLTGQIASLREFAAEFLAILARMAAQAAALQIVNGAGGFIKGLNLFGGGGSGGTPVSTPTLPTGGVLGNVTINVAVQPTVYAMDSRNVAAYIEEQAPLIGATVVHSIRTSGALDAALRGT